MRSRLPCSQADDAQGQVAHAFVCRQWTIEPEHLGRKLYNRNPELNT